mgnify:CR=1 FL=1
MKKLNIKVLSLFVAIAGIFAGCSQEELVKSDIDNATYPNAEIELSEFSFIPRFSGLDGNEDETDVRYIIDFKLKEFEQIKFILKKN